MPKTAKLPDLTPINERKENIAMKSSGDGRAYRGVKWSVNVVLSTSRLNKVLKPEIHLELIDESCRKTSFFMTVESF